MLISLPAIQPCPHCLGFSPLNLARADWVTCLMHVAMAHPKSAVGRPLPLNHLMEKAQIGRAKQPISAGAEGLVHGRKTYTKEGGAHAGAACPRVPPASRMHSRSQRGEGHYTSPHAGALLATPSLLRPSPPTPLLLLTPLGTGIANIAIIDPRDSSTAGGRSTERLESR